MLTNETKMQLARLLPDLIYESQFKKGGYFWVSPNVVFVTLREWTWLLREIARRHNLTRVLMLTLEASDEDIAKAILEEMREKKV